MQTIIDVYCTKGKSVRELIARDKRLEAHGLQVVQVLRHGRYPGWLKIRGFFEGRNGAVNIQWDDVGVLRCRVVNKGAGRPEQTVGDFVAYLLARHSKRIKSIHVSIP